MGDRERRNNPDWKSNLLSFGLGALGGAAVAAGAYLIASEICDEEESEKEEPVPRVNRNIPAAAPTVDYTSPGTSKNMSKTELRDKLADEQSKQLCVICKVNFKNVILMPCRHLCICPQCEAVLLAYPPPKRLCPVCRDKIHETQKAYV